MVVGLPPDEPASRVAGASSVSPTISVSERKQKEVHSVRAKPTTCRRHRGVIVVQSLPADSRAEPAARVGSRWCRVRHRHGSHPAAGIEGGTLSYTVP